MSTAACALHLAALDDDAFEEWLCLYFQQVYGLTLPPQRNGRSGQAQVGVDVMFSNAAGEWVGVQAKAYTRTQLTPAKFNKEVQAAHGFQPPLTHYVVCTLNDRDTTLQAHARAAAIHALSNVKVLALQDLAEEASRRPQLARALLQYASPSYLEEMRQLLADTTTPKVASVAPDEGAFRSERAARAADRGDVALGVFVQGQGTRLQCHPAADARDRADAHPLRLRAGVRDVAPRRLAGQPQACASHIQGRRCVHR